MLAAKSINVTATGSVQATGGFCFGIIVNSHSSGTLKLWNNSSAAIDGTLPNGEGLVTDTFTFPAGSGIYMFPVPIAFNKLFATVGGTLNCQVLVDRH